MITAKRFVLFIWIFAAMPLVAQTQPPQIIVQAASPANSTAASAPTPVATGQGPGSFQAVLKALQEMKAANEEILSKQQAALQRLDEMQKAADQLKVFSHND